jgi:hypothetical protein
MVFLSGSGNGDGYEELGHSVKEPSPKALVSLGFIIDNNEDE